jgi:exonuclease III
MKIKSLSFNIRGAKNKLKRKALFDYFKKEKFHFICIQETHIESLFEANIWRNHWQNKIILSNSKPNSAGVAILLDRKINYNSVYVDNEGRLIIINCKLNETDNNENFTLINVYAPNNQNLREKFFEKLRTKLREFPRYANIIVCGDFNQVLNESLDCNSKNHRKKCQSLIDFINEFNLIDIWRERNPSKKLFSWNGIDRNKNFSSSRIDYILCNFPREFKFETKYLPNIWSDHKQIIIDIENSKVYKNNNFFWWKYNSEMGDLFHEEEILKQTILEFKNEEREIQSGENKWPYLKYKIRQKLIKFGADQKKKTQDNINKLNEKFQTAFDLFENNKCNKTEEKLNEIRNELKNQTINLTKGAAIRSRIKWYIEGERPTAYYLNLEKQNYEKKSCKQLKWENIQANGTEEIINLVEKFYTNLYDSNITTESNNKFLPDNKITDKLRDELEKPLNISEFQDVINSLNSNTSPGFDGLTSEFYKRFWHNIKDIYLSSLELNNNNPPENLPDFFSSASTILLPKPDTNLIDIMNWRPISLLNTDYKILSKVITNRINRALPSVISPNQTGFMRGRNIGENICLIDDFLFEAKNSNISGALVLLDIKNAYDTVSRNHIIKTLINMNFGPNFIKWISLLFKNNKNNFIFNGKSSKWINILRGVRQGDPISPALFNIALQPLTDYIKKNKEFKEILGIIIFIILHFADDTAIFVRNSNTLNLFFKIWNYFSNISGLKLNMNKTKIIPINNTSIWKFNGIPINFENQSFKYLGIKYKKFKGRFCRDQDQKVSLIKKVDSTLSRWSSRSSTMIGKACISNSLAFSKLIFYSTYSENNNAFWKSFKSCAQKFIWNGNKPKVNYDILSNSVINGGLGTLNENVIKAAKIKFLTNCLNSKSDWAKYLQSKFLSVGGLKFLLQCNYDIRCLNLKVRKYYKEVLNYWSLYNKFKEKNNRYILWNNKLITCNEKSFFIKNLFDQGILYIGDIIDANYLFKSEFEISKQFIFEKSDLSRYRKLLKSIPAFLLREYVDKCCPIILNQRNENLIEFCGWDIFSVYFNNKNIRTIINNHHNPKPKIITKWNDTFIGLNWSDLENNCVKTFLPNKYIVFQLKILYDIIPTKNFLYRIKIKENPICNICNVIDDQFHYFIFCEKSKILWKEISVFILNTFKINIPMTNRGIILGINNNNVLNKFLNIIFIIGKWTIYKANIVDRLPTIEEFAIDLKTNIHLIKNKTSKKDNSFLLFLNTLYP